MKIEKTENISYPNFSTIENIVWLFLNKTGIAYVDKCIANKNNIFTLGVIGKILNCEIQVDNNLSDDFVIFISNQTHTEINIKNIYPQLAILPWQTSDEIPINKLNKLLDIKQRNILNYGVSSSEVLSDIYAYINKFINPEDFLVFDDVFPKETYYEIDTPSKQIFRKMVKNKIEFIKSNTITDYFDNCLESLSEIAKIDYPVTLYYVSNNCVQVLYFNSLKKD